MLNGVVNDRQFGPTVAYGAGGTNVELLRGVSIRLTPLARSDASGILCDLRSFPLLEGYRGPHHYEVVGPHHYARLMSVTETAERSPLSARFPLEIIAHAVWLYFCLHFRFRDVQDLLVERGVVVSHETIREWCAKFAATFAAEQRRRRGRAADKRHLDENGDPRQAPLAVASRRPAQRGTGHPGPLQHDQVAAERFCIACLMVRAAPNRAS